jgi:hypothetical protein
MTDQTYHRVAISLMVAGIIVGFVCWWLTPPVLWFVAGFAAILILAGILVAGKASRNNPDAKSFWK